MTAAVDMLGRLARSFRATAAEGRTRYACGPFEAFLPADSDSYLMNLATPVAAEADWDAALPALERLFETHGRRLRLEFFSQLHPGLEPALKRAGLWVERRDPVMALPRETWRHSPGRARRLVADDGPGIAAMEAVQWAAYGQEITRADQDDFRPLLVEGLRSGSMSGVLIEADGRAVATALMIGGAEAAELAGVATLPEARGRGHAGHACRAALDGYFAGGGALAWLSAAPAAGGLYRRLGFVTIGEQLNMGRGPA